MVASVMATFLLFQSSLKGCLAQNAHVGDHAAPKEARSMQCHLPALLLKIFQLRDLQLQQAGGSTFRKSTCATAWLLTGLLGEEAGWVALSTRPHVQRVELWGGDPGGLEAVPHDADDPAGMIGGYRPLHRC